jgi:hypothetical protein
VLWLRGLKCWYFVLGSVALDRGFEPKSDLELFFAEIFIKGNIVTVHFDFTTRWLSVLTTSSAFC